jgi:RND family efflux transporter MFP subunit
LQSAKVQLNQLSDEYKRYKELYANKKVPANSYEKIESAYLMAKTSYENAVNQLNDTRLKAPFSGYVHEKMTENFQSVAPGQPIVSLMDVSKLDVVIAVPENQINYIRENTGNSFLQVKNAQVSDLPLQIKTIGKKALKDGLYEVKFFFENQKDLEIYPGMTAVVTIIYKNTTSPMEIPSSSVFHEGENSCVWKYNAGTQTVEKRTIQIGSYGSGGKILVTSGIQDGDVIVTGGVNELSEGQLVEPLEAPSKTNVGGML